MIPYELPIMTSRDYKTMEDVNKALRDNNRYLYRLVEQMKEHEKQLQKEIDVLKGEK